jgi:hypothetical protein
MARLRSALSDFGPVDLRSGQVFRKCVGAIARFGTETFTPVHAESQGAPYPVCWERRCFAWSGRVVDRADRQAE